MSANARHALLKKQKDSGLSLYPFVFLIDCFNDH